MTFILFVLMGVSWVMEIISFWVGGSAYIWIPSDVVNILSGFFVFIILVCKPHIWHLLKIKIPCLENIDDVCCPSNGDASSFLPASIKDVRERYYQQQINTNLFQSE